MGLGKGEVHGRQLEADEAAPSESQHRMRKDGSSPSSPKAVEGEELFFRKL